MTEENDNENMYQINQDTSEYILSTNLVNDKLRISCEDSNQENNKIIYSKDFSLDDLTKVNRLFYITSDIQKAKIQLESAIERQKIGIIKEKDENSISIIFYMMLGTETINFTLSLPKQIPQNPEEKKPEVVEHPPVVHEHSHAKESKGNKDSEPLFDIKPRCSCPLDNHRIDVLEDNTSNIKMQHEQLKKDINKLAEELINQRKENENLKRQIELSGHTEKEQNQILRAENDQLKKQLEELNQLRAKDQIVILDLNKQNNELKQRLFKLEEISKKLENDLLNARESTSSSAKTTNSNEGKYDFTINSNQPRKSVRGEIIHGKGEIEWISKSINKNNKKITFNILYKATVDSDRAAVFHQKCDSSEKTLVLVETDKGKRFGGYTTVSWKGDCEDKKDENAFIFSLDKKKIYENIKGEDAIGCYPKFGPTFLGCQIKIYDNAFEKGGSTFEKGLNYNTAEDFELTDGEQQFGIKEIEVYQVIVE